MADKLGDYFSTAANELGGVQVTNLVQNNFEKNPSLEGTRQAYQGLQFGFNEIGTGEVENAELKIIFEQWLVVLTGQTNFSSVMSLF